MFAGELRKQKVFFATVDAIALTAAFATAIRLHDPSGTIEARLTAPPQPLPAIGLAAVVALWILVFHASDLYRKRNGGKGEDLAIIRACSMAAALTLLAFFLGHVRDVPRLTIMLAFALSVPLVYSGRVLTRSCLRHWYASPRIAIPLVICGFNHVAHSLMDQVLDGLTHYEPVGFLDSNTEGRQYRGYPLLGGPECLADLAALWPALETAIAMPDASRDAQERIIRTSEQSGVRWWIVPWMLCSVNSGVKIDVLGSVPLIGPKGSNIAGLNYICKRALDLTIAGLLLIFTAPIAAFAVALIWLIDGGPVLFRQTRIGIHGQPFQLLKLRTMSSGVNDQSHRDYARRWIQTSADRASDASHPSDELFKMANDHRITPIGRFLRRFSIDELPQLINVVRGEMSVIGPRPPLPYEVQWYEEWHRRRLDVVPGITGLWQVSGRNRLSFNEMVRLDVQYLEDWSLLGDLKILMLTIPTLLRGNGL